MTATLFRNSRTVRDLQKELATTMCLLNGAIRNANVIDDNESSIEDFNDARKAKYDAIRLMMLNAINVFIHSYCIYDAHFFNPEDNDLFYETCKYMNELRTKLGLNI